MGVKEDFLRLKQAWVESGGEEREKADKEMDAFFDSLKPNEKKQVQEVITDDFTRLHDEAQELKMLSDNITIRKQMNDILPFISVSYLAKHYFGKSTSWFYQRLNGNIVNGKISRFTKEEISILNNALKDMSKKIGDLTIAI